ncbi:MAG TPA: efflux RND transporter periplasmic adaptor subunit [Coriobacteriia bacterium]
MPRKRRRWIWWVVLGVVVLVVAAIVVPRLLSSSNGEATYATAKVERRTLTSTVSGSGNLAASGVTQVQPGITGTVEDLSVKLGDTVKAGQLLFRIVNADLDSAELRAEASYQQAKQQVQQAKNSLTQSKNSLYNAQHPSAMGTATPAVDAKAVSLGKQQVTAAQLGVTSANRSLDSASLALKQARDNADKRTVSAPLGGVITSLSAVNGQSLSSGGSSASAAGGGSGGSGAAEISDLSTLRARVQVNEVDLVKVQLGQHAAVQFDALPGGDVSGTVSAISPTGTNTQGVVTYDVDVTLSAIDPRLKPNMSCTVEISIETKENALVVPTSAVKSDASTGKKYVSVVSADGLQFSNVEVSVGIAVGTSTEILTGLTEGQTVVTSTASSTSGTTGGNQRGGMGGMGAMFGGGRP